MNLSSQLFISAYTDYLQNIIDSPSNKTGEIRIITQSLMPHQALAIFQEISQLNPNSKCVSYLRVAHGLVQHWLTLQLSEIDKEAFKILRNSFWLDEADKLTWYRNRTVVDEETERLLILLVGIDHTTDKGGLADFFVCQDNKVWYSLHSNYQHWLKIIAHSEGLTLGEQQLNELDDYLLLINSIVPLTLSQKTQLLETWINNYQVSDSYSDDYQGLLTSLFASLTNLGMPYLRIQEDLKLFKGKKGQQYLKTAYQFISHRLYNQGNRKTKDLEKIKKYLSNNPEDKIFDISGDVLDKEQYLYYLESFILNADNNSKSQLIEIDLLPVLKALKIKEEKEETTSRTSIPSYSCHSFEAVCLGLNSALEKYSNENLVNSITNISISIKHFQHDFSSKDAENNDQKQDVLAKSVLQGVLGGIENYIKDLNLNIENCKLDFLTLDDKVTYRSTASNPHVVFEVSITGEASEIYPFKWKLSEFQIERLHYQIAKRILQKLTDVPNCILPVMTLPKQIFQAIYHASNQEEACRLMSLGLNDIRVIDIFEDYNFDNTESIKSTLLNLSTAYHNLLKCVVTKGLYAARKQSQLFLDAYFIAFNEIIKSEDYINREIKERFYYGFFMIQDLVDNSLSIVDGVLINGYHPAVFELIAAQIDFINFAISDTYSKPDYEFSKKGLNDIFVQSEIESPILALKQKQGISTHTKSFGWLHYIGETLDKNIDLSVQALLQETDEEEDTQEVQAIVPEESIIYNALNDYQKVYGHAKDGLRILATNVSKLSSLLAGLTKYCNDTLLKDKHSQHYSLHISVYTTGLSKLTAVNTLKKWQEVLTDAFAKKDKLLKLKISHFVSDGHKVYSELMTKLEKQEATQLGRFDIAFNFSFLQSKTYGKTDPAPIINLPATCTKNSIFPIIYYPKPIIAQHDNLRELRLSQRQISIQSKHANLTAHLEASNRDSNDSYFVVSKMEYEQADINLIEALHKTSQWVVNIDEYFDYNLLKKGSSEHNKVISFSSGYGHYGELNVTLSTAHHAPEKLKESVRNHLSGIMHYLHKGTLPQLVDKILHINEALSGVANIKAVLGNSEEVRNLYGYALSIKAIATPEDYLMSQWIPLDSCQHWFKSQNGSNRADLLQLSLKIDENNKPILRAHIVEAKVGSLGLVQKAEEQIEASIHYLSQLFAPRDVTGNIISYNRRYWWGQLHRALVLRSHISQTQAEPLNIALDYLSEGDFEIYWTSSIVICHTQDNSIENSVIEKSFTDEFNHLDIESKKYQTLQFSEVGFERTLLNEVDWESVPDTLVVPTIYIDSDKDIEEGNESGTQSSVNVDVALTIADQMVESKYNNVAEPTDIPVDVPVNIDANMNKELVPPVVDRKIMVGTIGSDQVPVYWEYHHKKLSNRHLLIFGASGSGKTYAIQCLLSELAQSGVSSFIIDYTDGFLKHQSEPVYQTVCQPQQYFIIKEPLPINPFKSYSTEIEPGHVIVEKPFQVAIRVKNILSSVYNDFGSQQVAIIDKVLEAGLASNPKYNLEKFIDDLQEDGTRGESIANKIRTLVKMNCFDTTADNNLYEEEVRKKHAVQIIQLTQIPKDLQRIITEFILWDLWAYVQKNGNKDQPITIVLDEMQNLDHSANSPVDKLLREGRKFGISLVLATQTVSSFNAEQKDRLFQASTKLFFKPATTEVASFADLLSKVQSGLTKNDWIEHLNGLEKGQCFFVGSIDDGKGQFKEVVKKLDVTALEKRDLVNDLEYH